MCVAQRYSSTKRISTLLSVKTGMLANRTVRTGTKIELEKTAHPRFSGAADDPS